MATITSSLVPAAERIGYIAPVPNQELWQTPIPRGEVVFSLINGAITVSGAGDNQLLLITATLPSGFAYVLAESYLSIKNADVDAWQAVARFRLRDSSNTPRWSIHQRYEAGAVINETTANFTRTYQLNCTPMQKVMLCDRATSGELVVSCMNLTLDQAAGTVDFFCRFYQFDLNQGFHWAVNTAFPTRGG